MLYMFLLLVQLGEGALVGAIQKAVGHAGCKTQAYKNHPQKLVIASCDRQHKADEKLCQG